MKTITLPADIFDRKAIIALSTEFNNVGQLALIMILCEIAKNGYFIHWNNLQKNFMSRNLNVLPEVLERIIARLVEYEYFDAQMFYNEGVITSFELQKRYFRSRKRREKLTALPYLLPQIIERYAVISIGNLPENSPSSTHSSIIEISRAEEPPILNNDENKSNSESDEILEFEPESCKSVNKTFYPPSKTKVIKFFSSIIKSDTKTVRELAMSFYEQAKASKWRFTDPVTRQPLTWQQTAERTQNE